jgi:hypothetical protein
LTWLGADLYPGYFAIGSSAGNSETTFTVEPVIASWPGNTNHLFLRLKIAPKP